MSETLTPLPGRTCGTCQVCCVDLEIDDPQLHKPDETPCLHLVAGGGCGVYATRPRTCAAWYCGWRLLNVDETLRPDRCGVLMVPEISATPGFAAGGLRLVPVGGDLEALFQPGVIDLAGLCVARGVPIFLSHGGGAQCKRALINALAKGDVERGDRAGFVGTLRKLLAQLVEEVARDGSAVAG
jgi:hypothetical protein